MGEGGGVTQKKTALKGGPSNGGKGVSREIF